MMDLCYVRVVLKVWEIYGPEIRAKITDKITKIRHFKAKNRFFGSFSAVYVRNDFILVVEGICGVYLGVLEGFRV